jgi:cytochrome P450
MMSDRRSLPPGPRFLTPFGMLPRLRRDAIGLCMETARDFGDVVCFRVPPWRTYMIFHPDHLKHVLQENNQNYVKGILIQRSKVLIGDGLFSSEGSFWRRQRRLAQPAFHRERIAAFGALMVETIAAMLARWEPIAAAGTPFDVAPEMSRLTLDVVGKALFSMDLSGEAAEVGCALRVALEHVTYLAFSVFYAPLVIPTPRNLRFRRALRALDAVVYDVIATRRRAGDDAGDLLAMLLRARDEETGEGMSDRQLRDEVMTFFLAGHETTAVALAWTWYLLARHPAVEERLRAEVGAVLDGRAPTVEDLGALVYTRMVVEEVLRLYPPLWAFPRQTIAEDEIGGYRITANSLVSICPYVTHRHPEFWDDPERFDPERFTPERAAARPRYAYLPFSGGPRQCIGNEFALMEAQLAVAMTVQSYRLSLVRDEPIELEIRVTLRPRGGVMMTAARV